MVAVLDKLNAVYEAVVPKRRKVARVPAWAKAHLRSADGERSDAVLIDLSTYGLRLRSAVKWLRVGRYIEVEIEGDQPLQAVVRWQRDGEAGLEFLRPIPADRAGWNALLDSPLGY